MRARREAGQGVDATADDFAIGRHPVVGQTVPGRKGQRLDLGMKKGQGRGKAGHAAVVAADVEPASRRTLDGEPADDRRVIAFGRSVQRHRARPRGERAREFV